MAQWHRPCESLSQGFPVEGSWVDGVAVSKVQPSVLLVVDDGEMRSLLRDGLRNEGYVFHEVEDEEGAVLSVLRAVPDVIITEIRLSAGGLDYVSRLRGVVPRCPIIVMTAFGDERARTDVLRAGATVYFSKPVHLVRGAGLCQASA